MLRTMLPGFLCLCLCAAAQDSTPPPSPSPAPSQSPSPSPDPKPTGETVTLKVVYTKGDSISTAMKSKLDTEVKAKFGSGEHAMEINSATVAESEVEFISRFADVDDKGVLQKEGREYSKAKSKTISTTSFGEHEGKPQTQNVDLPIEGKSFDLSREEGGGTKVTPKGDAAKLDKNAIRQQTIFESVDPWLPDHPVRAGERWTVEAKKLRSQFEQIVARFKFKTFEGTFDCTLKEIAVVGGRRVAKIGMTFNLEGDVDLAATMKMQSDDEDDDETPKGKKGPAGSMTFRIKKGSGECQFDVDHSMAISNEMKANMEIEIVSEEEDGPGNVKGKGTVESSTSWKREEKSAEEKK